jgi:mannosylglycerate hydrolase
MSELSTPSFSKPRPVAVVVQTHWDREWYFSHQTFVARLLEVMSRVVAQLESGVLTQFLFDGQTAAYEDLCTYGEPELVERVRAHVRAKRIVLGPWYVMADEFLVTGESLLRNLEIGMDDAIQAGNCQRVGYLPDTFGHVGQMPQLLNEFGIPSAVMWRGVDSPVAEFDWCSPDGTKVGSIYLTEGYYQHPLNVADWRAALSRYLQTISPRSMSAELLLTQGGDHLQSVDHIAERIAQFNGEQQEYRLQQRTLEAHVQTALNDTQGHRASIHGALRNNKRAFVLPDVLSTRRYLKRMNQHAENRLLGEIEPLFVMLRTAAATPRKYLRDTWRMVIQNQAHDSICGCSVDAVHREMETRYQQIEERIDALRGRALAEGALSDHAQHGVSSQDSSTVFADDTFFTLANPLPKARKGIVAVLLFLKGAERSDIVIADMQGNRVLGELFGCVPDAMFRSPVDDFPDRIEGYRYEWLIDVELAGLEAKGFQVVDAMASTTAMTEAAAISQTKKTDNAAEDCTIENAQHRVVLDADGTLTLFDRHSDAKTELSILHELDAGDSYNYSPPPVQSQVIAKKFVLQSTHITTLMQEMTVTVAMHVPTMLSADRKGRVQDEVENRGTLRIRLAKNQLAIDFVLDWENNASDQRTRLLMSLPNAVTETHADSAFDWVSYPVRTAQYPTEITRQEMPVVVNPSLSAIQAGNLLFCHRAMQEYEILQHEGMQALGVTMIRSVGWMSRRDLVTRGVGAGPDMTTPDAQCTGHLGREQFQFQIALGAMSDDVHPLSQAEGFRRPVLCLRGQTPHWAKSIEIDATTLQVSACRMLDGVVELRLFNPTDQNVPFRFTHDGGLRWRRTRADGTLQASADQAWVARSHQIVTLRSVSPLP